MTRRFPTLDDTLRAEIRKGGNLSRLARSMGLDYGALQQRYAATDKEPDDITIFAKEGMRRFVVAARRAGSDWPKKYEDAIQTARVRFDAGTHEMMTGRKDGWEILYSVPRLVRTKKRTFFSSL